MCVYIIIYMWFIWIPTWRSLRRAFIKTHPYFFFKKKKRAPASNGMWLKTKTWFFKNRCNSRSLTSSSYTYTVYIYIHNIYIPESAYIYVNQLSHIHFSSITFSEFNMSWFRSSIRGTIPIFIAIKHVFQCSDTNI